MIAARAGAPLLAVLLGALIAAASPAHRASHCPVPTSDHGPLINVDSYEPPIAFTREEDDRETLLISDRACRSVEPPLLTTSEADAKAELAIIRNCIRHWSRSDHRLLAIQADLVRIIDAAYNARPHAPPVDPCDDCFRAHWPR